MKPDEVVTLVAALLFIKWVEHLDIERETTAKLDGMSYDPILPKEYRWSSLQHHQGKDLEEVLRFRIIPALFNCKSSDYSRHLQHIAAVLEPYSTLWAKSPHFLPLHVFIEWTGSFDLTSAYDRALAGEILGQLFYRSIDKARRVEYFTPPVIVQMMVNLVDPKPGERIYDPCFGSGGFLVESAKRLNEDAKRLSQEKWYEIQNSSINGIERNKSAYVIGLTRLILADITNPKLELHNTILNFTESSLIKEKFDCIFANPPWGIKIPKENTDNLPNYVKDSESFFLYHVMSMLKAGGRASVVVPDSLLFRSGPARHLRETLLLRFRVESVTSLSSRAFRPATGIKSSIIFFRKEKPAKTVHFIELNELQMVCVECGSLIGERYAIEHEIPLLNREDTVLCPKCRASKAEFAADIDHFPPASYKPSSKMEIKSLLNKPPSISWDTPIQELSRRNWELVAKRSGNELLDKLLKKIYDADPSIEKSSLGKVADVITGIRYSQDSTSKEASVPDAVPMLRISDIRETRILPPALFLTSKGKTQIKADHYLKLNDLLMSVSGSVGKIGYVHAEHHVRPSVFANSLVLIRPKEAVLPKYLMALLQSDCYQQWITGHSKGSTIQHLSAATLRNLPIPLPKLPVQQNVINNWTEKGGDALQILVKRLEMRQSEASYLTRISSEFDDMTDKQFAIKGIDNDIDEVANWLALIEKIAVNLDRKRTSDFYKDFPEFWSSFFNTVSRVCQYLINVSKVDEGPALYSILQRVANELSILMTRCEDREDSNQDERLVSAKAVDSITFLWSFILNAIRGLEDKTSIVASIGNSSIVVGKDQDIEIRLMNKGVLPVRNLFVKTDPDIGKIEIPYIAESSEKSFSVLVPAQASPGKFEFKVSWTGLNLPYGNMNLAVKILPTEIYMDQGDLGASPYITGNPIPADKDDMFIGRDKIISRIKRQFDPVEKGNIVLLEGNRRSGKTSILYHIESKDILPGWIPVYISFQGGAGDEQRVGLPTAEIFKRMTKDIFKTVYRRGIETWFPDEDMPDLRGSKLEAEFIKTWNMKVRKESPLDIFENYLRSVFQAVAPKRLLLMMDEFEKIQDGILSGVTSPQVPENLRYFLHTYSELSAILAYTKFLRRWREEYWSMLFGLGYPVSVGAFDLEDARLLVTRPAEGKLIYTDEATDRIVSLCAQQPYLIQVFCNHIFDIAAEASEKSITLNMIDQAAALMAEDSTHFYTLWKDHVENERQRYILLLCALLPDAPDPITLQLLEIKLEEAGIVVRSIQKLGDDLKHLRDLELVRMSDNGSGYNLFIPLMAKWIRKNIDVEDLRRRAVQENEEAL